MSSLVHSSTLVTAGVYLILRYRNSIRSILSYLLLIGALTMLMAGFRALFETDIKKIVALSTLSQLGLIMSSIGVGIHEVAFFHLLTHAFFKALLFISVGGLIHIRSGYQDLRRVSLTPYSVPLVSSFRLAANIALMGLPYLSGFFSKDIILERA